MNVYVDSSVLLRVVLGEAGRLRSWGRIDHVVSSELIRLESLRTIDRARLRLRLDDEDVAQRRWAVLEAIESFDLIPVTSDVLERPPSHSPR